MCGDERRHAPQTLKVQPHASRRGWCCDAHLKAMSQWGGLDRWVVSAMAGGAVWGGGGGGGMMGCVWGSLSLQSSSYDVSQFSLSIEFRLDPLFRFALDTRRPL